MCHHLCLDSAEEFLSGIIGNFFMGSQWGQYYLVATIGM